MVKRAMIIFFLAISLIIPSPSPLFAKDIQVTATLDKTEATLEDELILSIEVNGSQQAEAPELKIPEGFYVESEGSSSNIQIINGSLSSSITYTYRLSPQKLGVFILGPFVVNLDDKKYPSNTLKVTVTSP